jgi:hypothetical protein
MTPKQYAPLTRRLPPDCALQCGCNGVHCKTSTTLNTSPIQPVPPQDITIQTPAFTLQSLPPVYYHPLLFLQDIILVLVKGTTYPCGLKVRVLLCSMGMSPGSHYPQYPCGLRGTYCIDWVPINAPLAIVTGRYRNGLGFVLELDNRRMHMQIAIVPRIPFTCIYTCPTVSRDVSNIYICKTATTAWPALPNRP